MYEFTGRGTASTKPAMREGMQDIVETGLFIGGVAQPEEVLCHGDLPGWRTKRETATCRPMEEYGAIGRIYYIAPY